LPCSAAQLFRENIMIDDPNLEDDLALEFEGGEFSDSDYEPSPEEIAELKRARQEAAMGLTYTMITEDDRLGNLQCNQCRRVGRFLERPFPHKFACPMREKVKD
jgi:hypothetical protein